MRVFFPHLEQLKHARFISGTAYSSDIIAGFEHGILREKLSNLPGFEPGISWSVVRRVIHCATGPVEKPWIREATYPRAQFRANFKIHNCRRRFLSFVYHGGNWVKLIHWQLAACKVMVGVIMTPGVTIHIYANFQMIEIDLIEYRSKIYLFNRLVTFTHPFPF